MCVRQRNITWQSQCRISTRTHTHTLKTTQCRKLLLFSCPFLLILSTFPHISIYFSFNFTSLSAVYLFALVSMETTGLYLHEYHQSSSHPNILELHASNLGSFVQARTSLNTLWNSITHSFLAQCLAFVPQLHPSFLSLWRTTGDCFKIRGS